MCDDELVDHVGELDHSRPGEALMQTPVAEYVDSRRTDADVEVHTVASLRQRRK